MGAKLELENDRIRVWRVTQTAGEKQLRTARLDRLIVYLDDGRVTRTERGKSEELMHKAGDVVWRNASKHQVEVLANQDLQVIIVELKK